MQTARPLTLAVATVDMASVADHLARSSAFIVMEIADGQVSATSVRQRGTDACGNHRSFVEMLEGCQAVLCGGIGQGAVDALVQHGIQPVVVAGNYTVDEAVRRYLDGTLPTSGERVCLCH